VNPLLFVYGSLRRGFLGPQAAFLEARARYIGLGTVPGQLYLVGKLADGRVYPGWHVGGDGYVIGDVWEMLDPSMLLSYLDDYEGLSNPPHPADEYVREEVTVSLQQGKSVRAWAYRYNQPLQAAQPLLGSDYFAAFGPQL
jgi:gamma-glutamylcyclotransferase (GGCT)/AIG2-like uncharacterized protein YtfP